MATLPRTPAYVYMNENYTATVYDMKSLRYFVNHNMQSIDMDRIRLTKVSSSPKLNTAVVMYIEDMRDIAMLSAKIIADEKVLTGS